MIIWLTDTSIDWLIDWWWFDLLMIWLTDTSIDWLFDWWFDFFPWVPRPIRMFNVFIINFNRSHHPTVFTPYFWNFFLIIIFYCSGYSAVAMRPQPLRSLVNSGASAGPLHLPQRHAWRSGFLSRLGRTGLRVDSPGRREYHLLQWDPQRRGSLCGSNAAAFGFKRKRSLICSFRNTIPGYVNIYFFWTISS